MSINQIILISGWGTDSSIWNTIADKLDNPVNLIPWWECLSNDPSNNYLLKLLAELNDPVILVGWSLGGMIALSAAIACPGKVSGIVLVSSSARMVQDKEYAGVSTRVLKAMKLRLKADKQGLMNDFATMGISPEKSDSLRKDFVSGALEIDNDKLTEGLSFLQNCDLRDQLINVRIPVNIIHGECDGIMNPDNADYLSDKLLNTSLDIVGGTGHFMIQSKPEIITESIKNIIPKAKWFSKNYKNK